ncbi:MAG: head-tail adaptor protein [Oscillospiraceae bacterium]
MSLIDEAMTSCTMIDRTTKPDGEGGIITSWVDGASFNAAIVFDSSLEAKIAEKQGVTSLYTVTVPKNVSLFYHDVFRRESDGKMFRVTSDGDDKVTPERASFQFLQVTAEEYELT